MTEATGTPREIGTNETGTNASATSRTRSKQALAHTATDVGQLERASQAKVVGHLREALGYDYLGNWQQRQGNSNIEVELLSANLRSRGYAEPIITKAVAKLLSAATLGGGRGLYEANRCVYAELRYGVKVRTEVGEPHQTVWLIDWANPAANHFAVAEEVSLSGQNAKRPDLVLYINGIAVVTIELKKSTVSVTEAIRQNFGNQKSEFIQKFFSTVQLLLSGNDIEGLRYAVIDTSEKNWLAWREDDDGPAGNPLHAGLTQLCAPQRLLEIIRDFMVFDRGTKKTCRPNQYFGVKAAQGRIRKREGGIIWHTQGSGKSLTMVWLAKWILEEYSDARVLLITDRTELDQQIEGVFKGVNQELYRTTSGADLIRALNSTDKRLISALVQKFGAGSAPDAYLKELTASLPGDFSAKGNIFVFIDEAHRTQSGTMHDAMRKILPGAMMIGFTGTPLLAKDKKTTQEKFGSFIHTYKYNEAVRDRVVLDLRYEARKIDQDLSSPHRVDQWFDAQTRGLTDLARAELKKRWGTMQKVVSSEPRTKQIVDDICFDFMAKPRLADGTGNALLVCSSIYQACTFYDLFSKSPLSGKCAVISSYHPQASDIAKADSGEGQTARMLQYRSYKQMLGDYFQQPEDQAIHRVAEFEAKVKETFIHHPGQMQLLIVVDKLLTGFDAPSATYLYIDKKMRDHGLFQAICRVNRLDGKDKEYGYIVDYQDLFKSLEKAVTTYAGDALDGFDPADVEGLLSERLAAGLADLEQALEQVRALCEPVATPRESLQYQQFFCAAQVGNAAQLKANEPKRLQLYTYVATLVRRFAAIANDLPQAGYTPTQIAELKAEVAFYADLRDEIKLGSGEKLDFAQYEPGMRRLLDMYIRADPPETISNFAEAGLLQLIADRGREAIVCLPPGIQNSPEAPAEIIVNNNRALLVDSRALNPKYYDSMSTLLDAIIEERRKGVTEYEAYLAQLIDYTTQLINGSSDLPYPNWAKSPGCRALVDFFRPAQAIYLDQAFKQAQIIHQVIAEKKPDAWVGNAMKEKKLLRAITAELPTNFERMDLLLDLLKANVEYH